MSGEAHGTQTAHYQGKPFDEEGFNGLSGGVTGQDSLRNIRSTMNDDVDTTSLQGHANHDLKKGMAPQAMPHSKDPSAHLESRQPVAPGGHKEKLGTGTVSQETSDGKFIREFKESNGMLSDEMAKELNKRI